MTKYCKGCDCILDNYDIEPDLCLCCSGDDDPNCETCQENKKKLLEKKLKKKLLEKNLKKKLKNPKKIQIINLTEFPDDRPQVLKLVNQKCKMCDSKPSYSSWSFSNSLFSYRHCKSCLATFCEIKKYTRRRVKN